MAPLQPETLIERQNGKVTIVNHSFDKVLIPPAVELEENFDQEEELLASGHFGLYGMKILQVCLHENTTGEFTSENTGSELEPASRSLCPPPF